MNSTNSSLAPLATGLTLGVFVLAGGCGVKDPTELKLPLGPAQLDIVEAAGTRHGLALAPDGQVSLDGTALVKVAPNGRVTFADGPTLQLTKDGTVLSGGQLTNMKITATPDFVLDGATQLTMDDAGAITGSLLADLDHPMFNADGATLTYKGPANSRRTMMFVLAAALTSSTTRPAPVTPPSAAP